MYVDPLHRGISRNKSADCSSDCHSRMLTFSYNFYIEDKIQNCEIEIIETNVKKISKFKLVQEKYCSNLVYARGKILSAVS